MIAPVLVVLAAVFLVLGFAGVIGLLLAVGLAVACLVLLFVLSVPGGRWRGL